MNEWLIGQAGCSHPYPKHAPIPGSLGTLPGLCRIAMRKGKCVLDLPSVGVFPQVFGSVYCILAFSANYTDLFFNELFDLRSYGGKSRFVKQAPSVAAVKSL